MKLCDTKNKDEDNNANINRANFDASGEQRHHVIHKTPQNYPSIKYNNCPIYSYMCTIGFSHGPISVYSCIHTSLQISTSKRLPCFLLFQIFLFFYQLSKQC